MMHSLIKKIFRPIKNYNERIYEDHLYSALGELKNACDNFSLTLLDIGAAGNIEPRWKSISSFINYIGFEPDERSRKELIKNKNYNSWIIYPHAVWNKKSSIKINFTQEPQCSSFFTPNYSFTNLFPNPKRFSIIDTLSIDAVKLDSLKILNIDFIKLDIQGAELKVMEGASESLNECLGLKVEVEFLHLYQNQPLYGEIVDFLTNKDFEFIDFINIVRWERKENKDFGQCVFGDSLFLRTPEFVNDNYKNTTLVYKYLAICLLYNRIDLIDKLIELSDSKFKKKIEPFLNRVEFFKKNQKKLKYLNQIINSILGFFFYKNTRAHIIY